MPKLSNLIIRPAQPNDADHLYTIATDPRVCAGILITPSMEIHNTQNWLNKNNPNHHRFVADHNKHAIGSCSLTVNTRPRLTHIGDIGMMVAPDYWNQGVATTLLTAALDLADNWLNLKRIQLDVFTDNPHALHLYQKLGFEIEATKRKEVFGYGKFRDAYHMSRLAPDIINAPIRAPFLPSALPVKIENQKPKTKNLIIRPPRPTDAQSWSQLMRHPAVARTTLQTPSQELAQSEQRLADVNPNRHRFFAEIDGKIVGSALIHQSENPRQAHSAGLGMGVHPDYWGMGIGTKLMAGLVDLADNWLNLKRIELDVNTDNPAAIHLYEKFGFVQEGVRRYHSFGDGGWAHSLMMARIRD